MYPSARPARKPLSAPPPPQVTGPAAATLSAPPPPLDAPMRPPEPTPVVELEVPANARGSELPPAGGGGTSRTFMHGASLPPYRLENPAPTLVRAPLLPKLSGTGDELVEHLALPPGIAPDTKLTTELPTSVLEARVQFTLLARELGLDYRLKRGIELRADVSGIEAMQATLLETFPDHVIQSPEDAYEIRRHGALLGEILARRLGGEWIDISPNELGYWAMIVPPDTRVWPFGRVTRLVAMGHKERDLVSYFLELTSRARRL